MYKHGVLAKYHNGWSINLGGAAYIDIPAGELEESIEAGMGLEEALDEASSVGWEAVGIFIENGERKCLVRMDYKKYKSFY